MLLQIAVLDKVAFMTDPEVIREYDWLKKMDISPLLFDF